ncbi:MAG TPA: NAD(P)-dependent oxidoreductase [Bacteroidia bacterium]|jgi:D-3-phosphoglycerate dehydrogenase|nr:NAD(P)-dependent oxidoreductase [Bacteroidia bacterium]
MPKILFIDSNHPRLHKMLLEKGFVCDLFYDKPVEELKKLIPHYDGIVIRSKFKINKEIIDSAPNLKCIARAGAGMENIDVEYATKKGIICVNSPEGNRDAVAEHALGMLLMLFNNLKKADNDVREGKWLREENRGVELGGKTVGIIGCGNVGAAFAKRLQGFDVEILAYDKYKKGFGNDFVKESSPEEIFEKADILSLHLPLTEETNYLVNDAYISKFQKNIYVINTARGKNLNTADLVKNLQSGKILGACLDVLEYEAVSFEKMDFEKLPAPMKYLVKSDKVVLTPHIAGWTHESNIKIAEVLASKIINSFRKIGD